MVYACLFLLIIPLYHQRRRKKRGKKTNQGYFSTVINDDCERCVVKDRSIMRIIHRILEVRTSADYVSVDKTSFLSLIFIGDEWCCLRIREKDKCSRNIDTLRFPTKIYQTCSSTDRISYHLFWSSNDFNLEEWINSVLSWPVPVSLRFRSCRSKRSWNWW